jgi:hypothetical protein
MTKYLDSHNDHTLSQATGYESVKKPRALRGQQHSMAAIIVCVLFVAMVIGIGLRTFMEPQTDPHLAPTAPLSDSARPDRQG